MALEAFFYRNCVLVHAFTAFIHSATLDRAMNVSGNCMAGQVASVRALHSEGGGFYARRLKTF